MSNGTNADKKTKTINRIYRIAAILLVPVLISCVVQSVLLAKYAASGGKTDESAAVAGFSVGAQSGDTTALGIYLTAENTTGTDDYKLTVTNSSEVAVSYDISVNITGADVEGDSENAFSGGLSTVLYAVDADGNADESSAVTGAVSNGGTTVTFKNVGSFAPGDGSADYILRFTYDNSGNYVVGTYNFDVSVDFAQID